MNFKCQCGAKYRIEMPNFTGDIDASVYTDGVIEGPVVPREINVFICEFCKKIQTLSMCEQIKEKGDNLLTEPTTEKYLEILKDEKFENLKIRIKTWQRSNDKYRELDSLDDLKVKVELLKSTISNIPSTTHFNQYIAKMIQKKETLIEESSIGIIEKKIDELVQKRKEIFGRLKEKEHLNNILSQIKEMEEIGEIEVLYTLLEKENMKSLLDNLGDSNAEKILKAELYRNMGEFKKSITIANQINEKQYEKIRDLIKDLSERSLKKPARLNS